MKRFLNMWATLVSAIVLAWGASYFGPAASAAGKPERISVAYCADCVQFHLTRMGFERVLDDKPYPELGIK